MEQMFVDRAIQWLTIYAWKQQQQDVEAGVSTGIPEMCLGKAALCQGLKTAGLIGQAKDELHRFGIVTV